MAKRFDSVTLKQFASVGARARLVELDRERTALLAMFPELRRGAAGAASTGARRRRRRRGMSAAARRAVSRRMKRYWAERRKAKAGK